MQGCFCVRKRRREGASAVECLLNSFTELLRIHNPWRSRPRRATVGSLLWFNSASRLQQKCRSSPPANFDPAEAAGQPGDSSMFRSRALAAAAAALTTSSVVTNVASAACTRLAFTVNDYGKVGPTNDAKNLLDKYIAKWTSDRKITGYNTGPKAVSCELFLDVIVFDEYTCKAEATVCWNGPLPAGHQVEASTTPSVNQAATTKAAPARAPAAAKAPADGAAPIATGSVKAAPAAMPKAAPAATPAAPAASPAAPAAAPAAPAAN